MRIRIGLVMLVATIAALGLATLHVASPSGASRARGAGVCGGDRWYIRTLQDRPDLLPAKKTTLVKLTSIPRPKSVPADRRLPIEHQIFTVVARLGLVFRDPNLDLRTVLWKELYPRFRLISSGVPSPHCNSRAKQERRRQMGIVRQALIAGSCGTYARITGVAFFTSRLRDLNLLPARNRIELRPILSIECLQGS